VRPGPHVVRVTTADGRTETREILVEPGSDTVRVEITLPPAPAARVARLVVRTDDDADVFVDGAFAGLGPEVRVELEPGVHRLRVEAPDHAPYDDEVELPAGEAPIVAEVELRPRFVVDPRGRRLAWSSFGIAGGTAIGLSLGALSSRQRFDREVNRCGGCARAVRLADATDRKNHAADVFWLATVTTGVVAIVVHRRSRHEGPPSEARFTVGIGPGSLAVTGRFDRGAR
jgi:hypothetical protein